MRVQAGFEDESSLLVLDLEFCLQVRLVCEVALAEFNLGNVLVNVLVNHECPMNELLSMPGLSQEHRDFAMVTMSKVYGGRHSEGSNYQTAKEIAEVIFRAGVTTDSIIIVWHSSDMDLKLLRELLNSAGFLDVLPPKENCITMLQHFWAGLRCHPQTNKRFTARMDFLFPTLFASHPLVGKNHTALPDIQMLQLLVLPLIELQKPPSKRDLRRFPQTTQQFAIRGQPRYTALEKWLGVGYIVVSDPMSEVQADEMITELVDEDERDEIYDPEAEARLQAEIVLELQEDYELDVEYEAKMELQFQEDEEDGLETAGEAD